MLVETHNCSQPIYMKNKSRIKPSAHATSKEKTDIRKVEQ